MSHAPCQAAAEPLQPERLVGAVQERQAVELHVTACGHVLGVPALHPEDVFGHTGFDRSGQATLASLDAGEVGGVEADVLHSPDNHGGHLLG